MNKHTPGPWTVKVSRGGSEILAGLVVLAKTVGKLHAANARAMAIAPEALDLLERHLDWYEGLFTKEHELIVETRALLKRARGEL